MPLDPVLDVDGVKGKDDLLLTLTTTQTDFELVDVLLRGLCGFLHPDIRKFTILKGDGLDFFDIVQARKCHFVPRQLTPDPHIGFVDFEILSQIPVADDLFQKRECRPSVRITRLSHHQ